MSGKRSAAEAPADEPEAKAQKTEEEAAKAEEAEAADHDAAEAGENKDDAAPARRSTRARNPARKARVAEDKPAAATKGGAEAKTAQVTYKEGEPLAEHLKSEGTLVEVKIPAECTVSTNQQVRARTRRAPRRALAERRRSHATGSGTRGEPDGRAERRGVQTRRSVFPTIPKSRAPDLAPAPRRVIIFPEPDATRREAPFFLFPPPPDPRTPRTSARPPLAPLAPLASSPPPSTSPPPPPPLSLPSHQVRSRQLWGTDVYTSDSDLVAVLMHAGYYLPSATVPPSLVELRAVVRAVPSAESYASTSANGIRSRSWGAIRRGCSFRVERCSATVASGATVALKGGGGGGGVGSSSAVAPTFFPNVVESVVNTRASAANSERRGRLIQEVTVQYNLCNEPWLKYGVAAVADQGFKKSQWTAARLRRETLYLESHGHRYELSFDGDAEAVDENGCGLASEDKYRWARCKIPRPLPETRALGVPLPADELDGVVRGLKWRDVKFGAGSVVIKNEEVNVVRLHFLSRT